MKCPNCMGELRYDIDLQKVKCDYCGSVFTKSDLIQHRLQMNNKAEISNIHNDETFEKELEKNDTYEGKAYRCSQCGATLLTFDETAITFCSYCGSQAMLEDKMMKQNCPDFIIPFKKSKEECIEAYKKRISNFIFAPSSMKSDFVVEKFRGIYMPYVIYNLKHNGLQHNSGSKYAYRRGDYVYYHDYDIEADVDASYDGISYDLVSKFYDDFSTAIPFNFQEAVPFEPGYLAGFYADSLDVDKNRYESKAEEIVKPDVIKRMKNQKDIRKYGCTQPIVSFDAEKSIGMFPVYFLAIRDKYNENVHYAVVNGQTGKVAVDLPIDFKKYILSSILLTIIIFLIINSSLVLTPTKITIFSLVVAIASFIISKRQIKKIDKRANHEEDLGMNDSKRSTFKYFNK